MQGYAGQERRNDTDFALRLGRLEADAEAGRTQRALIFDKLEDVREAQHKLKDDIVGAIGAAIEPLGKRVTSIETDIMEAKTTIRIHRWYLAGVVGFASLFGPKLADAVAKKLGFS